MQSSHSTTAIATVGLAMVAAACASPTTVPADPGTQDQVVATDATTTDATTSPPATPVTSRPAPTATATPDDPPATPPVSSTSPTTATPTATATPTPTATPTTTATPTPEPTPTATASPTAAAEAPEPTPQPSEPSGPPLLERGDESDAVRDLQQTLAELGYWIGPVDGVFGSLTEQAVMAFQGWEQITRDGVVGPETRAHLDDASRPSTDAAPTNGLYIDEHRGVLLVTRDGATRWAFHVSAGSYEQYDHPEFGTRLADTPNGTFEIYRQVDGPRNSDLGFLNRPKFFHEDGIALHGSPNVPAWGVSHGCVRVTNPAINFIWANDLAPIGTTVVVVGPTP